MDIEVVYSDRRSMCLKVNRDGTLTVLAPVGVSHRRISEFVASHKAWILKKQQLALQRSRIWDSIDGETSSDWERRAQQYIPQRVAYYANLMGVCPQGIKITKAKGRFGSCSAKNSLCFSVYLMYYPDSAIDSVIVHELAHIRQKNHSPLFYAEISRVMPDYKERKKLLKNGIL